MKHKYGLRPTVGYLDPAAPEAQWWSTIFGNLEVPLKGIVPHHRAGANGEPEKFYDIDIDRLTPEQFDAVCKVMSAKFNVPLDEVREGVRGEHGLPVLASHIVTIIFDGRHFL